MASAPAARFNPLRNVYLVALAVALGLLLHATYSTLYRNELVYWNVVHLLNAKTQLEIDLTTLHGGHTMEQMKKQFPDLDWYCKPETNGLGDLICVDDHIASWNGNPAMMASFWFRNGGLTHIAVQVPRWKHAQVKNSLFALLGTPQGRGRRDITQADIVVWQLRSGGGIVFNIDPEPNPLQWSTVFWYSPEEVKKNEGLLKVGEQAVSATQDNDDYVEELTPVLVRATTAR